MAQVVELFSLKNPPRKDSHWLEAGVLDLIQSDLWETRVELTTVEGTRQRRWGGEPSSRRVPHDVVPEENVQFRRGMAKGAMGHVGVWVCARVRVGEEDARKTVKRGRRRDLEGFHIVSSLDGIYLT